MLRQVPPRRLGEIFAVETGQSLLVMILTVPTLLIAVPAKLYPTLRTLLLPSRLSYPLVLRFQLGQYLLGLVKHARRRRATHVAFGRFLEPVNGTPVNVSVMSETDRSGQAKRTMTHFIQK
jgi:hypothetical protein